MSGRLAVIGASSMVGSQFCEQAQEHFDTVTGDLPKVDITKKEKIESFFKSSDFPWVILFSAVTDVSGAEKERDDKNGLAWRVNVEGTRNVAEVCQKAGRGLIFISTDFVFDGTSGPNSEENPVGPNFEKISWYGITKIEGEKIVSSTVTDNIILRISYPYSGKDTGKEDLILRIIRKFQNGELYPMYSDQIITPTYIPDIEPAVNLLISKKSLGIYHLASPGIVSQYDFAKAAIGGAKVDGPKPLESKSITHDIGSDNFVPRPKDGGLKVDKIKNIGFSPTDWRQGIEKSVALWLK